MDRMGKCGERMRCPEYGDYRCCHTCKERNTCIHNVFPLCKYDDGPCEYMIEDSGEQND